MWINQHQTLLPLCKGEPIRLFATGHYPVRYVAFENPGSMILYRPKLGEDPWKGEVAVWHWPLLNDHWPGIVDGIYAELRAYPALPYGSTDAPLGRGAFRAEVEATRPDMSRIQHIRSHVFSFTREDAAQTDGVALDHMIRRMDEMIREIAGMLLRPAPEVLRERAAEIEAEAASLADHHAVMPGSAMQHALAVGDVECMRRRAARMRDLAGIMESAAS